LTHYSFKNGVTIDIPDHDTKEQELKAWTDICWQMSLMLDPPLPADPPKPRKEYTLTYKGYQKRKLKDKTRLRRKKK